MITEIKEFASPKERLSYRNWKNINYDSLHAVANDFLDRHGLTFEDYAGCMNLAGNELYRYPELARVLQELSDYPIFRRTYEINRTLNGKAFIKYFYKTYNRCYRDFKTELASTSGRINNLIHLYGEQRRKPIINDIDKKEMPQKEIIDYLTINGVKWFVSFYKNPYQKQVECMDLCSLLAIEAGYCDLIVEEAIINTPFIAIRLKKDYRQKGHINWYSLDTKEKVSKAEIVKWMKQH
jgi:hypothetical protein